MTTIAQAHDVRLPWQGEPEYITVTTGATSVTLVGQYNNKIEDSDSGKFWAWHADGAKVYAVVGQPTLGAVTASGTSVPTITVAGTPACCGSFRIDVNATSGSLESTTFDWSLDGTTIETGITASGTSLTLGLSQVVGTMASGNYNADNFWTFSSDVVSASTSATSGTAVPIVLPADSAVYYALPEITDRGGGAVNCIGMSVIGASATVLRIWPATGR